MRVAHREVALQLGSGCWNCVCVCACALPRASSWNPARSALPRLQRHNQLVSCNIGISLTSLAFHLPPGPLGFHEFLLVCFCWSDNAVLFRALAGPGAGCSQAALRFSRNLVAQSESTF